MWFPFGYQLAKYIPAEKKAHLYNVKGFITDLVSDHGRNKIWIATTESDGKIYNYNYETDIIESLETKVKSSFSKKLSKSSNSFMALKSSLIFSSLLSLSISFLFLSIAEYPDSSRTNCNNLIWLIFFLLKLFQALQY